MNTEFIAPVLVQVALTFLLMMALGRARVASAGNGEVKIKDIALSSDAWPQRIRQIGNSYANQFEMPVLFYVLVGLLIVTKSGTAVMLALAWVFVLSRIVHALIHVTSNRVIHRFYAFLVGVIALGAMWVLFALRMLGGIVV